MSERVLDVGITAPFALQDVMASVEHEAGTTTIELKGGRFTGELPGRPRSLRLLDEMPPEGAVPAEAGEPTGPPEGEPVAIERLFGDGVAVPESGVLRLQIVWGTPCHQAVETGEGRRFGSYEHQMCADTVGLDENGGRLEIAGLVMPITRDDLLPVAGHRLRFGDIIALAGDFYAHLDDDAERDFGWAWPVIGGFSGWLAGRNYQEPLAASEAAESEDILGVIARDRDADHGVAGETCALVRDSIAGRYPARRYLALASQNFCHFGSQPADGSRDDERNLALRLYSAYHKRALAEARAAGGDRRGLLAALACDAFGCHFLTDLFASGHMRVPRRELADHGGILVGSLHRSHAMHAEDNRLGLWCAARGTADGARRTVWRAFGDGMLRTDEAAAHRQQVREAVRRSAAEVFAASRGVRVEPERTGEYLIPQPLASGERPRAGDVVLGDLDQSVANHYPRYWLLADGHIANRVGGPDEPGYRYRAGLFDVRELDFGDAP